eukprot:964217-Pyramimonas_sp.AAC.1
MRMRVRGVVRPKVRTNDTTTSVSLRVGKARCLSEFDNVGFCSGAPQKGGPQHQEDPLLALAPGGGAVSRAPMCEILSAGCRFTG